MKLYLPFCLLMLVSSAEIPTNNFKIPPTHAVFLASCDEVPELNKKIITYVNTQINKKVGRGECWDLAAEALNSVGATWDKNYVFGKEIDVKKDCVYPGDIMQFTNVTVQYSEGNKRFKEVMDKHTAIIYQVKGSGDFVLADQNTTTHGRKVGLNPLDLKNISKGKFVVYRPVK